MHKPYLMDRILLFKPLLLFLSLFIISIAYGHFWCAFSIFTFSGNPYNWQISKDLVIQNHLFAGVKPAVWPDRYRLFIQCTEYVPEWFLSPRSMIASQRK